MENVRMEAKYPEITLGEEICIKIKQIYFADEAWPVCYRKVADKFTLLKKIMRKFYGISEKEGNIELLKKIQNFDTLDIQEAFAMEKDYLDKPNVSVTAKYDNKIVWIPVPADKSEIVEKIRELLK